MDDKGLHFITRLGKERCALYGIMGLLLFYVILLHSFFHAEREEWKGELGLTITAHAMNELESRMGTRLELFQKDVLGVAEHRIMQRFQDLQDLHYVRWALQTPEIERAVELRKLIDAVGD